MLARSFVAALALGLCACQGEIQPANSSKVLTAEGASGGSDSAGGVGGSAAAGSAGTSGSGGSGQCAVPIGSTKVFHGTLGPTAVPLSAGQIMAVGMLDLGGGLCSGTLVKRQWVLTALHCTEGVAASEMEFSIGQDPDDPNHAYEVAEKFESDSFDTALLKLGKSPLDDDASVVPIRINGDSLEEHVGAIFEGSGYGLTEDDFTGTRYFTAEPLIGFNGGSSEFAEVDGEGEHGLCGGDSGGPLLKTFAGGEIRVVGDLTGGDESCIGVDNYTRTDVQFEWLTSVLGPPDDACGAVTAEGVCEDGVATWCEDGHVHAERCTGNSACGFDEELSHNACVEGAVCNGETLIGECDGETAIWCENDFRHVDPCAPGETCTQDENGNNRCIANPCADVKLGGECVGTLARVCFGGSPVEVDCAKCGQTCSMASGRPACQ
jgi:hypothetical protein